MTMPKLFQITSVADNLRGYKNVGLLWFVESRNQKLFGPDGSLGVAYQDAITDYEGPDPYPEGALEELFTESKAKAFVEFVGTHRGDTSATIKPYDLPIPNNMAGCGALACGGGVDFLCVGDAEDYDLPFKVYGYYDLRECEFDASLPGARRTVDGIVVKANGSIEPWYDGDEPSPGDRRVLGQLDEAEKTARWFLSQENAGSTT